MKSFFTPKKKSIIAVIACICALAIIVPLCIWCIPKLTNEKYALQEVTVFSKEDSRLIEESIISSEQNVDSLSLCVNGDSPLSVLDKGDVFVISQVTSNIFGEAYFGKITSKRTDGNNEVIEVVTPEIDEVFYSLDLDCDKNISANNIESINLADGVELVKTGELNASSFINNRGAIMQMNNSASRDFYVDGDDIGFKFDVDLLDLLKKRGVISNTEVKAERITTADQANNTNVYYTNTGLCYHRINCHCLAKSKHEISLKKAVHETNLQPCKVCEAPILEYDNIEEKISASVSLKLEGNVVLKDLSFRIMGADGDDWNYKDGFSNLTIKTEGTLQAETTMNGNLKSDISGIPTRLILVGDEKNPKLYFEGLNEKLLPLAFITMNAGFYTVKVGPACDEVIAPFTIGLMLYTDMSGNITVGTEIYCSYTKSLSCQYDVFRDGEFVKSGDSLKTEDKTSFDWRLKAEGDVQVDLRAFNASLMLYVGNINILEFCLARMGIEATGNIVLAASNDSSQNELAANAKMCVYVELLDLDVKYKYKDKKDLINVDLNPLYRFDLAKFEYAHDSSQEAGADKNIDESKVESDYAYLVTDAYNNKIGNSQFSIPKINIKSAECEQINKQIWTLLYENIVTKIEPESYSSQFCKYTWVAQNGILSLSIHYNPNSYNWTEYTVYNINIADGSSVSDETLISMVGFSTSEYNNHIRRALGSECWIFSKDYVESLNDQSSIDDFNECLNETISSENINKILPYLNEDGQICIVATIYSPVGEGQYNCTINLEDYPFVEYYDKEATLSMNNSDDQAHFNYYKSVLEKHPDSLFNFNTKYTICDIDDDGICELIVIEGGADYYVYTYKNGSGKSCGAFSCNTVNSLYKYNGNGLVVFSSGTGNKADLDYVDLYVINNGEFSFSKTIKSSVSSSYNEIINSLNSYTLIDDYCLIDDYSLLK